MEMQVYKAEQNKTMAFLSFPGLGLELHHVGYGRLPHCITLQL